MIGRFATPMPASSLGALSYNLVEFTSSGTWTKPSGLIGIELIIITSGGGGASGSRTATNTVSRAGSSGGGGAVLCVYIPADDLSSTESVTIGAGGSGGASVTADDTNGSSGTSGGTTSFGPHFILLGADGASSSTPGQGTQSVETPAGYIKHGYLFVGPSGRTSSSLGSAGRASAISSAVTLYSWQGPSEGGGVSSSNFASAGGIGTELYNLAGLANTPAARGALGGGAGGDGVDNWGDGMTIGPIMLSVGLTGTVHLGSSGGGGGSSINSAGGAAGAPGDYGSGGAGGGASRNGYNSGAGGAGASGAIKVLEIRQL